MKCEVRNESHNNETPGSFYLVYYFIFNSDIDNDLPSSLAVVRKRWEYTHPLENIVAKQTYLAMFFEYISETDSAEGSVSSVNRVEHSRRSNLVPKVSIPGMVQFSSLTVGQDQIIRKEEKLWLTSGFLSGYGISVWVIFWQGRVVNMGSMKWTGRGWLEGGGHVRETLHRICWKNHFPG